MKRTARIHPLFILIFILLITSCEPISIKDYQMEPYSGAFTWTAITKKAAWSNRYDHAAVVFKGKMWIFGGYDSSRMKGDTYLEDIWNSTNGKDWTLVTDSAPWKGRRGQTVTLFNDGTGDFCLKLATLKVYPLHGLVLFTLASESSTMLQSSTIWKSYMPRQMKSAPLLNPYGIPSLG